LIDTFNARLLAKYSAAMPQEAAEELATQVAVSWSYGLPLICFVVIAIYAMYNRRWEAQKLT